MKILYILIIILFSMNSSAQEITLDDLKKLKSEFEKKYSISLFIEEIPYSTSKIDYKVVTKEFYQDLYDYMILLEREFNKYPKKFLWKTRLRAIAIVRGLSVGYQLRTAIPDVHREILFYDFFRGSDYKVYQKHVIHHEFYHMIDQEFNHGSYWNDPIWDSLNKPHTKYGSGGVAAQANSHAYDYTHPYSGFVNLYAKSGIGEDKAEVFASLFIKEEYEKIIKWGQKDKYLKNKVDHMKSFLEDHNKNFKQSYWKKLHQ